jgi:hypothetical protein
VIARCSVPGCTVTHAADSITAILAGGWTIERGSKVVSHE